jgi:hypothetical protein
VIQIGVLYMPIGKITSNSLAAEAVTITKIAPGAVDGRMSEITANKLHTTLDLSTKTLTLPQESVTAHQSALSLTKSQISDLSDLSTNSDNLTEGSTNLFFTDARADARAQIKIDAIVGSAPGTLDTLQELGAALGDDPNFATTLTTSIATKLPLVGGTITGPLQLTTGPLQLTAPGTPTITSPTSIIINADSGNGIINFSGSKVMNLGDPVNSQDAVTKSYVESYVDSMIYKDSDVDTRLNTNLATAGQVLSWNGTIFTWVTQSSGGGGVSGNTTVDTIYVEEDIKFLESGAILTTDPPHYQFGLFDGQQVEPIFPERIYYEEVVHTAGLSPYPNVFFSMMPVPPAIIWSKPRSEVASVAVTIHLSTYAADMSARNLFGSALINSQIIQGHIIHDDTTPIFTITSNVCTTPGTDLSTVTVTMDAGEDLKLIVTHPNTYDMVGVAVHSKFALRYELTPYN